MACEAETAPSTQLTEPPSNKGSLYVGDLDPNVTSADLTHVFSEIGKLSSVRICKDSVTGDSLRYGYVNFENADDASKALAKLNHTNLKGKRMRIMWCERDPLTRKNGTANLFVKNLDPSIDSARLESAFGKFGTVVSCKVPEEDGKSKGFGFVQFDKEDSAVAALNAMHDTFLEGKRLYVAKFLNKVQRATTSKLKFTNLYVKNLDEDITKDILQENFSKFGTVQNAVIMRDSEGKSKGFGFVNFESPESARKAAEALNGTPLGSKKVFVGRAQKKAEREELRKHGRVWRLSEVAQGPSLLVKNLDPVVDDIMLEKHFSSCGKVNLARVSRSLDGISEGYGFVGFSKPEEAEKASCTLHGSILQGKPISVTIERGRESNQGPPCSYSTGKNRLPPAQPFKSGVPLLESHSSPFPYSSSGQFGLSPIYFPPSTASSHDSPWISGWSSTGWVPDNPFSSYFDPYCNAPKHFCHPISIQHKAYQQHPVSSHNFLGDACSQVKKSQQGNSSNVSIGKAQKRSETEVILKRGKNNQNLSMGAPNMIKNLVWEEKCLKNATTAAGSTSKAPTASSGSTAAAASGGNYKKSIKGNNQFLGNLEPECVQNSSSNVHMEMEVNEAGLITLLANPQSSIVGKKVRVLKEANVCRGDDGVSLSQKCSAEA